MQHNIMLLLNKVKILKIERQPTHYHEPQYHIYILLLN